MSQNTRSGLIGILLPSYQSCALGSCSHSVSENGTVYTPCNVPPRLYDNVQVGYAKIYSYPTSHHELIAWIHEAFQKRNNIHSPPSNTLHYFKENRREYQNHWQD